MNRKWIGALLIVIFACSSIYITTIAFSGEKNVAQSETLGSSDASSPTNVISYENTETTEEDVSIASGYYDDIGDIYVAVTSDGIDIKMLRYHAPGKGFNYGTQPVLLFSGLCSNMNQFIQRSTPELKEHCNIALPTELADWAKGDENIRNDPMLYYSIAYYLWKMGYDPWFANYRGTGYGEMKSENGDKKTTLDDFALFDVRAAVRKVYEVTKQHPVIGGHSTGGLTSVMYLQGCKYRWDGHVRSYQSLLNERNGISEGPETVKGFIGLDPAWIPGMTQMLDNLLVWLLLDTDLIVDLRGLMETLLDLPLVPNVLDMVFELISDKYGEEVKTVFMELLNLDTTNVNEAWLFHMAGYWADKLYFRTLAQYLDFIASDTVRECFKNSIHEGLITPPDPWSLDGYYYYVDNTYKISVPAITFLASMENQVTDLVDADKVIRDIVNGKTQTEIDECYIINGAHIDMPGGIRAPVDLYPKLGAWLAKLSAL